MEFYTVYMHISPSDKRYIGITKQEIKRRWKNGFGYKRQEYFYNAIEKYGWDNFQHIIIAKGLDEETAKWLEIELIREWDTTNKNKGYNNSLGGESYNCSEKTKEKISKTLTGRKLPKETVNKMCGRKGKESSVAKPIICLTTGMIFDTITEGAEYYNCECGHIVSCCRNKRKSTGKVNGDKLIWMYLEDYKNISKEEVQEKINNANKNNRINKKPVICVTTGVIFDNITEASKYYGIKHSCSISFCCKGKYKTSGKLSDGTPLVWKYLEDYKESEM